MVYPSFESIQRSLAIRIEGFDVEAVELLKTSVDKLPQLFNRLKGDMFLIKRSREFLSLSATRTRTLQTNFLWNAAGNAVLTLCQWGILVVFAKLGSPTLVGQLVYGFALTAPLFVVAGLQLRSIQATDDWGRKWCFGPMRRLPSRRSTQRWRNGE